jgi:hypothetical protein
MPLLAFPSGTFSAQEVAAMIGETPSKTANQPQTPPPKSGEDPAAAAREADRTRSENLGRAICAFKSATRARVFRRQIILFNVGNQWSDLVTDYDSSASRSLAALGDDLCILMLASAHDGLLALKLPASVT